MTFTGGVETVKLYVVQKGDTMDEIARKHGMTIEEFKKMNTGLSEEKLTYGKKVKVAIGKQPLKRVGKENHKENSVKPLLARSAYPSVNDQPKEEVAVRRTTTEVRSEMGSEVPAGAADAQQSPNQANVRKDQQSPGDVFAEAGRANPVYGPSQDTANFSKIFYPKESPYPMTGGMPEYSGSGGYNPYSAGQDATGYPATVQMGDDYPNPVSPAAMENPTGLQGISPMANPTGPQAISPMANPTGLQAISPMANPTGPQAISPMANPTGPQAISPMANPTGPQAISPMANPVGPQTMGAEVPPYPYVPQMQGMSPNPIGPQTAGYANEPAEGENIGKVEPAYKPAKPAHYPFLEGEMKLDQPYKPEKTKAYPTATAPTEISKKRDTADPAPYSMYQAYEHPYHAPSAYTPMPSAFDGYTQPYRSAAGPSTQPCGCGASGDQADMYALYPEYTRSQETVYYYGGHLKPQEIPFSDLRITAPPTYNPGKAESSEGKE
ncbi:LysM peptidoglycan-binding domain-containing protein [Sporolactobacillus sp. THM7-7]|nr:LysM peptidoglycan-binding domain-containing protein [Sporolactobacillus sp. THM7-7]